MLRRIIHAVTGCLVVLSCVACESPDPDFRIQAAGELGSARTPVVVTLEDRLVVVWSEDRGAGPDLYMRSFDTSGNAAGAPRRLTDSGAARRPTAAFVGGGIVLAWVDRSDGMMEVYAAGLDPGGTGLVTGTNVSDSRFYPSTSPRVITHGERALLIWTERGMFLTVRMVALDGDGQPRGEAEDATPTSGCPLQADIATDGRGFVVASNEFDDNAWRIELRQFDDVGRPPAVPKLPVLARHQWAPSIARIGEMYFVAYRANGGQVPSISVASQGDGASSSWEPVGGFPFGGMPESPTLVGGEGRGTVMWRENDGELVHLFASEIGVDGCFGGANPLLFGDVGMGEPVSAVPVGDRICVAWERLEKGYGSVHLGCTDAPTCMTTEDQQ